MDTVRALLPGPTPAEIGHVAGLLTGPDASDAETKVAANLRQMVQILNECNSAITEKATQRIAALAALPADERPGVLAAMLRTGFDEAAQRRSAETQRRIQQETQKKAEIRTLLEERGYGLNEIQKTRLQPQEPAPNAHDDDQQEAA